MFDRYRTIFLMAADALVINLSVYAALLLRFEGSIPPIYVHNYLQLIPWYTLLTLAGLYYFRLYNRMWSYASLGEMYAIFKAISASSIAVVTLVYTTPVPNLPRSVYVIAWVLAAVAIGVSRLTWRILRDGLIYNKYSGSHHTLIIGAGGAGVMLAREMHNNPALNLTPVGFIDDNPSKQKLILMGLPVLGTRHDIAAVVQRHGVDEIIIAIPSAGGRVIRELMEICRKTPARIRIFQGTGSLFSPHTSIRNVNVEDLLRREPVQIDLDEIARYLTGKTVLVTGAGGSIGSELCRQIVRYRPERLILLDYSENNLFEIHQELKGLTPVPELVTSLTDIKDRVKMEEVMARFRPQVVIHAAAYKHVPMMELNPIEAVRNNIIGSRNAAEMAQKYGSDIFILISTDKAVRPKSIMGCTKRIAEMMIQELNQQGHTRFAAVRFGNVLGSSGSVLPIFEKQIKAGGPLTITHPDMTRYFMTIPEAAQLVIQAGALAQGGEIFVLDMGEPIRIMDLARDLILLHGLEPDQDIPIICTGVRPGEKLQEELFSDGERKTATRHNRIYMSDTTQGDTPRVLNLIDGLLDDNDLGLTDHARTVLQSVCMRGEQERGRQDVSGSRAVLSY